MAFTIYRWVMTQPNGSNKADGSVQTGIQESPIVKSLLSRFRDDESGAIEYSLICAGIAVLSIIAVITSKLVSFVP